MGKTITIEHDLKESDYIALIIAQMLAYFVLSDKCFNFDRKTRNQRDFIPWKTQKINVDLFAGNDNVKFDRKNIFYKMTIHI